MTDIAELGIRVDAIGIEPTRKKLDQLTAAMQRLGSRADAVSREIGLVQDAQGRWRSANGRFISESRRAELVLGSLGGELKKSATDVDRLRKSVDPAYSAMQKYQSAVRTLDTALGNSQISFVDYERSLELVSQKFLGASDSTEAMDRALTDMQSRIAQTIGMQQQLAKSAQDSAQVFQQYYAASDALDRLRSSYDPLFAASKRYEAALRTLDVALEQNVITQQQHTQQSHAMANAMFAAGRSATQYGRRMGAASAHTTNLLFQMQDIGMMLAMGQSPLLLAAQQGTQVSGVLYQMQQQGLGIRTGLANAFRALISPMALVTVGAIAAGAAIFQFGMRAWQSRDRVLSLDDAMESAEESMQGLQAASEGTVDAFSDLVAFGGRYTETAERILDVNRQIAQHNIAESISDTIGALDDDTGFARLVRQIETGTQLVDDLSRGAQTSASEAIRRNFEQQLEAVRADLVAFAEDAGTSVSAIEEYVGAMGALEAAEGPQAQADAARELLDAYLATRDASEQGADINQEFVRGLQEIQRMALGQVLLEERINAAYDEQVRSRREQNALQRAVLETGENSALVEAQREEIARREFRARMRSQGVINEELDAVTALWERNRDLTREVERQAAAREAQDLLRELEQEAEIRRLILEEGEDSRAVEEARHRIARDNFAATVENMEASRGMKIELMQAWDAANRLGDAAKGVDFSGALSQTAQMASDLGVSLRLAEMLVDLENPGRRRHSMDLDYEDPRNPRGSGGAIFKGPISTTLQNWTPEYLREAPSAIGGGGGGADTMSEAEQRAQELREAVESLNEEAARGITPFQRYRSELKQLDELRVAGLSDDAYSQELARINEELANAAPGMSAFTDAFEGLLDRSITSFRGFASKILDGLADMFAEMATMTLRNQILAPAFGGGGGASGFFGSVLGGGGGGGQRGLLGMGGFLGFLDAGGRIGPNQHAVVGERRPEIVTGPANVIGGAETARIMRTEGRTRVVIELGEGLEGRILERAGQQMVQFVSANNQAQRKALGPQVEEYQRRGTTG